MYSWWGDGRRGCCGLEAFEWRAHAKDQILLSLEQIQLPFIHWLGARAFGAVYFCNGFTAAVNITNFSAEHNPNFQKDCVELYEYRRRCCYACGMEKREERERMGMARFSRHCGEEILTFSTGARELPSCWLTSSSLSLRFQIFTHLHTIMARTYQLETIKSCNFCCAHQSSYTAHKRGRYSKLWVNCAHFLAEICTWWTSDKFNYLISRQFSNAECLWNVDLASHFILSFRKDKFKNLKPSSERWDVHPLLVFS